MYNIYGDHMSFIERILIFLDSSMKEPTMYGWFHITFLILLITSLIIVKVKYNKLNDKSIKKVLLICSIICLSLEVYKQINFSFNYDCIHTWWNYQWYAFPFQFCSTPMYIALIASLTKNKKIEKAAYTFLATYGVIAGISVMLYPSTVFIDTIGINIQTMIHHSIMVFMGVFLIINNKIYYKFKDFIYGNITFVICLFIALIIDIVTYYLNIDGGLKMFFISPFYESSLPVFNIIYRNVNYIIFLLFYILVFSFGSYLILLISKLLKREIN